MYAGERFNSFSHLIGAALALAALVVLVVFASLQGDPWKIVCFSIYGATLFLLYTLSTLYHSLHGRTKRVFQKLDHAAIYLLIAGSYTPFTLVTLRGAWGWSLFGVVWGLAITGIVIDSLHRHGPGLVWLLIGGLCYTGGMLFYRLDKKLNHAHGIWHLFVLAGSICHFLTILLYVL